MLKNKIVITTRGLASSLAFALATVGMTLPTAAQSASAVTDDKAMVAPASTDAGTKMRRSMDEMNDSIGKMKMSGDVDHDFIMMMKAHHQGAIDMAQMEVDSGKDPAVIKAAKKIIGMQKKEIEQFDDWLKKHPMK